MGNSVGNTVAVEFYYWHNIFSFMGKNSTNKNSKNTKNNNVNTEKSLLLIIL